MRKSPKRSPASAFALGSALVVVLALVVGVAVILSVVSGRAKGLPSAVEEARQAGLALEARDLVRKVDGVPDAYPAAKQTAEIFNSLPREVLQQMDRDANVVMGFEASFPERTRYRSAFHRLYQRIHQFLSPIADPKTSLSVPEPEVRFSPRKQTVGSTLEFLSLFYCANAVLDAEDGEIDDAKRDIWTALAIRKKLDAEGGYIAMRRQGWAEIRLQRSLVRLMQLRPEDASVRSFAAEIQSQLGPLPNVKRNLAAELASTLASIASRKKEQIEDLPFADVFKEMGKADVIRIYTHAVQNMPEDSSRLDEVTKAFEKMDEEADRAPIYGLYAKGYRVMEFTVKDVLTRRRLAQCALKLWNRVRAGEPISALPESLGEDRLDPHTGQPFRILDTADNLTLYSVGRDGIDDGGKETPPKKMGLQTRDVIFAIPKPG